MHPLFISIGNIPGHICMAATSHAWQCVVFMPIPKFNTPKACQLILQAHVWHNCVNIVTMGLKCLAHIRGYMPDSHGNLQYCFTPLVAWTADLPEQLMIAGISKNASPVTEVTHKQFRDAQCHSPCMSKCTLECINKVIEIIDPWDLCSFQKNVHLPCWRNWPYANLFVFLLPEILHTCHKFFFDHILTWCKEVVSNELNMQFKCHHKCIRVRHFRSSVSHVKQMTGREHHDIQHTIISMIAGCVPLWFLCAIHTLINFIYQAQSPSLRQEPEEQEQLVPRWTSTFQSWSSFIALSLQFVIMVD
ncbi:hypothetical protein J3A83DRAFT_4355613 [Scleroderma citrinum]